MHRVDERATVTGVTILEGDGPLAVEIIASTPVGSSFHTGRGGRDLFQYLETT
jgi:hypothetical protein